MAAAAWVRLAEIVHTGLRCVGFVRRDRGEATATRRMPNQYCVHPTRPRRTAASRHPALRWRAPARRPPTCEDGIKACGAAWAVPDRIARRTRLAFGRRRTAAAAAVPPARFASGFADHVGSDGALCSLFVLPRLKAVRKQNGAPEASFSRNGMRQRGRLRGHRYAACCRLAAPAPQMATPPRRREA
jgi:hypothetical protein